MLLLQEELPWSLVKSYLVDITFFNYNSVQLFIRLLCSLLKFMHLCPVFSFNQILVLLSMSGVKNKAHPLFPPQILHLHGLKASPSPSLSPSSSLSSPPLSPLLPSPIHLPSSLLNPKSKLCFSSTNSIERVLN